MKFLWTTEGGNFIINDRTREGAVRVAIQERLDCGENLEDAIAHFRHNDDLIAIDDAAEYDSDSPTYLGELPEDLW